MNQACRHEKLRASPFQKNNCKKSLIISFKNMKSKYLLATAAAIIAVAVYTLTLSFTETPSAVSRLEALANGEDGESGGGTGNENSESGGTGKYKMKESTQWCQEYRWVLDPDGNGGYNLKKERVGDGPKYVTVTKCISGTGSDYTLSSCTPYDPCNPEKPTI